MQVQKSGNPPVCKIMDFHKERYKQQEREKERAKSKVHYPIHFCICFHGPCKVSLIINIRIFFFQHVNFYQQTNGAVYALAYQDTLAMLYAENVGNNNTTNYE